MIVQFAVVEAGSFKPRKWRVAKSGGYTTHFEQARQAQKRVNQQNARKAKHGFLNNHLRRA